jgi:alanine racemase
MRPCWTEIRTRALEENMRFLASLAAPHAELLAMVKGNAYGHSLALCAPAAVRGGAGWLGVTSVEEGIAARALCPDTRVLIMSGIAPGQAAAAIQFQLTPIAWELWQLDELEAAARATGAAPGSFPVHLEVDTGMSRQGVLPGELSTIFSRFAAPGRRDDASLRRRRSRRPGHAGAARAP